MHVSFGDMFALVNSTFMRSKEIVFAFQLKQVTILVYILITSVLSLIRLQQENSILYSFIITQCNHTIKTYIHESSRIYKLSFLWQVYQNWVNIKAFQMYIHAQSYHPLGVPLNHYRIC